MGEKIYVAKQDTLEAVQQTVNKTDTTIGDIGDPAGVESLVGLIKNIPETVPTGAVKSVQRGEILSSSAFKVAINPVNVEKSFILLSGDAEFGSKRVSLRLVSFSSNSFTVGFNGGTLGGCNISWQVIELF